MTRSLGTLEDDAEAGVRQITVEGYMVISPFAAASGSRPADAVVHVEPGALADRLGLLLFAAGVKGDDH